MWRVVPWILLCVSGCASIPTLDSLILRPRLEIEKTPLDWGYEYQEFTLTVGEGRSIVGWHIPSAESKALLVVIPGSDANKGLYTEGIPIYNPHGYDLLVFDYEGFGSSPGTKSLSACLDDAQAAVTYALGLHDKVFVYGVSLGAPLTVYVTAKHPEIRGCMLEGCFIPTQEAALWLEQNGYLAFLLSGIANLYIDPQVPEPYDILKYIQQVSQPKLIMHSTEDRITPFEGGVRVFEAAPEPKEFWEMRGDHGRMVRIETDAYMAKVTGWLDAHLGD